MSVGHFYEQAAKEKILNFWRCCDNGQKDVVDDVFEIMVWDDGGRFVVAFDPYTEFVYEATGIDSISGKIGHLELIDD